MGGLTIAVSVWAFRRIDGHAADRIDRGAGRGVRMGRVVHGDKILETDTP